MSISTSSLTKQYELIRWIVMLFLAGAFYALVMQYFIDYTIAVYAQLQQQLQKQITLQDSYPQIAVPLILVALLPIFLSLVFTMTIPEKRLVPALYINIIMFSWLLVFGYNRWQPEEVFLNYMLLGIYTVFAGVLQDRLVTRIIGIAVPEDQIIKYCITVNSSLKKIEEILLNDHETLEIADSSEPSGDGLIFSDSARKASYNFYIEVRNESAAVGKLHINAVFFNKGMYNINKSKGLERYAKRQFVFLKDLLRESGTEVFEGSEENADDLVKFAKRRLSGISPEVKRISWFGWVKLGAIIASMIFAGVIYSVQGFTEGAVAIVVMVLLTFVAFEYKRFGRRFT